MLEDEVVELDDVELLLVELEDEFDVDDELVLLEVVELEVVELEVVELEEDEEIVVELEEVELEVVLLEVVELEELELLYSPICVPVSFAISSSRKKSPVVPASIPATAPKRILSVPVNLS